MRLARLAASAILLSTVALVGSVHAGNYDTGSLATEFLQSRTLMTVLSHDDEAAPNCKDKKMVKATPTVLPTEHSTGAVTERKWQEQWTLNRCGLQVTYYIFFTEVGKGGAYYSIIDPPKTDVAGAGVTKAEVKE
ncbi:MAG TPA: hypothetical protein VEJ16_10345 [Alphaproteobacteria bacterium]|nr:hypothetical protein [Alphaproteobacteria bacterium]